MRQLTLTFMLKLALRDETAEHVVSVFFFVFFFYINRGSVIDWTEMKCCN